MSEKNKIEELEKKLDETRKILDDLIYHFIYRFGEGNVEHLEVVRNPKKEMLKHFTSQAKEIIDEMTEEECDAKLNIIFKAELEKTTAKLDEPHYTTMVKLVKETTGTPFDDDSTNLENLDDKIKALEKGVDEYISNFRFFIDKSSEFLWPIFEEIKEKKELQIEQFKREFIIPYTKKRDEIAQKIEEQRKAENLAKIREKEEELEKLKKGL